MCSEMSGCWRWGFSLTPVDSVPSSWVYMRKTCREGRISGALRTCTNTRWSADAALGQREKYRARGLARGRGEAGEEEEEEG